MKLTQQPNLRAEDFQGWKEADSLFKILNPFFNDVGQILDHNIDFDTNFKAVTKSFNQTGITLPIKFVWPYPKFAPMDLRVIKAKVSKTPVIMLCAWDYNASTSEISISKMVQIVGTTTEAVSSTSVYDFTVRVSI